MRIPNCRRRSVSAGSCRVCDAHMDNLGKTLSRYGEETQRLMRITQEGCGGRRPSTSASGFLIPPLLFEKPLPSHMIGILSLVLLAIARFAFYGMKLAGALCWIYALTA